MDARGGTLTKVTPRPVYSSVLSPCRLGPKERKPIARPPIPGVALRAAFHLVLLAVLLDASSARCDEAEPVSSLGGSVYDHLLHGDRLLGDPGEVRTKLQRLGIDVQLYYHQVLSGKFEGAGANPDGVFGTSGSYDFLTLVDLQALAGWQGGSVLLHVKGQYDRNVNRDVGALSNPIDDADFDSPIYVSQVWLQQAILNDRLRFQIGLVEQQTLFDRNAYANSEDRQFLATFLDNNGIVPLPGGLAAAIIAAPFPFMEVAVAGADADDQPRRPGFESAFDGFASLSWFVEASIASPFARAGRPGHYRVGVVVDGREKVDFRTSEAMRGHLSVYLSLDQVLWRTGRAGSGDLGVFARVGYADPNVNRSSWFWSVGFEQVGAIPTRSLDAFGFGSYQAIGSEVYRSQIDSGFDRETGIELYYAIRALGWLVITPDVQFILDPGATSAGGTAIVATLRTRVTF